MIRTPIIKIIPLNEEERIPKVTILLNEYRVKKNPDADAPKVEQNSVKDKLGRTLIRNKKTGNQYFVVAPNEEKHEIVHPSEADPKAIEKAEKISGDVSKPSTEKGIEKIKKYVRKLAKENGQKLVYRKIFGRTYLIGTDKYDRRTAYDWDGNIYDINEFYDILKSRMSLIDKLNNIHKIDLYLGSLNKIDDEEINALVSSGREIKHELLTDNKSIKNKLTRSYSCVLNDDGEQIIVKGRFKGYKLQDMINAAGRQVAGTAYNVDRYGKLQKIEYKDETKGYYVKHEPYLTRTQEGKYLLILPKWDKEGRKAMKQLAKTFKSVQTHDGYTWTLSDTDFENVQEAIGGMALSEQASKELLQKITERKQAIEEEVNQTYDDISMKKIPGFIPTEYDFMSHQRKAIGTILKRGHGVVGLDTGTGKTAVSLGIYLSWLNDGTLKKDGKNGKALFVVPPSLRGNPEQEIRKFCGDPDKALEGMTVISYTEFQRNSKKYEDYGCVFFDEAQALRGKSHGRGKNKTAEAARLFNHPRKVLLTASIMEKSPMDLYNLVSIGNNNNVDEHVARRNELKFVDTYCLSIGGKVVGMKEDEVTKKRLHQWVKENAIYCDKTDVQEIKLPSVTHPKDQPRNVTMNKAVREKFTEMATPIMDTLTRMQEKYKDKTLNTTTMNQEIHKVFGQIVKLSQFSNLVDEYVPGQKNPKVEYAKKYIDERLSADPNNKTITFTDTPRLAQKTAKGLSEQYPHKKHILGLNDRILVYQDGKVIAKYAANSKFIHKGKQSAKGTWQTMAINMLQEDPEVCTFNLTSAYGKGHNIQAANGMLHLDRDTWNNQTMSQRTARAWRTGQTSAVDVRICDLVHPSIPSMDILKKYSGKIEADLFDEIIKGSKDADLTDFGINIVDWFRLLKQKNAAKSIFDPSVKNLSNNENDIDLEKNSKETIENKENT